MVLCPDASGSGQLTQRYPSANQVTLWVNGILDRLIPDRQPGFTSQGLKAIMLSWASKAGVDEYDRHVLGGHSMKGRQTAATYARDTLTAPVKRLEEVITSVRHGSFLPDSSRSNMFRSSKKDDKLDSDARGCTDVVIPTSSETVARRISRRGRMLMDVVMPALCLKMMWWMWTRTVRRVHHLMMLLRTRLQNFACRSRLFRSSSRSFIGKSIAVSTNMFALTNCTSRPWALRLELFCVEG